MADFELTMQDPPRMDERLTEMSALRGETILAVFDFCDGADLLIVTENRNWIVLKAQEGYSCEEGATIEVVQPRARYRYTGEARPEESVADYVSPRDLLNAGVITPAAFQELQARADAKAQAEKERKASHLRSELAKLEGRTA